MPGCTRSILRPAPRLNPGCGPRILYSVAGLSPALNPKGYHVKNHSVAVRSVTVAAAAALSLGVAAPIMPANAQVPASSPTVQVTDGTIDANIKGSLTIFKRQTAADVNGLPPTGEAVGNAPGDPLKGAKFTLSRVNNVNLSTNEGLVQASKLTVADAKTKGVGPGTEKETDGDGKAQWTDLEVGVYLLQETFTPDGFAPAADSLVFIPMTKGNTDNGGTQWLYDVTAYPKNKSNKQPEKTVIDTGINVGSEVKYVIDTYAQNVDSANGQKRTIYRIEDTLDSNLTTTEDKVKVFRGDQEIKDGFTKSVEGNKVVVYLDTATQQTLENGEKISVEITATVNKKPEGGDLKNQAFHFENNPNDQQDHQPGDTPEGTPKKPTNEVHTFYGDLEFTKVNSDGKGLGGAQFEVFGINGNQTCENTAISNTNRQKVNGVSAWTSGDDGKVTITGLHANNIANFGKLVDKDGNTTEFQTANEWTSYCLVETKSPAGYELLAKPIEFKILAENNNGAWSVKNGTVKVGDKDNQVVNLEDSTPKLPLTGGMGIGILAALGALIIAAGAYSAKRRSA